MTDTDRPEWSTVQIAELIDDRDAAAERADQAEAKLAKVIDALRPNEAKMGRTSRSILGEVRALVLDADAPAAEPTCTCREALGSHAVNCPKWEDPAPIEEGEREALAYLITAFRMRERELSGPITDDLVDVARPLSDFLMQAGFRHTPNEAGEREALIEQATWALIDYDTDVADRGVRDEHYRGRRAEVERIAPILASRRAPIEVTAAHDVEVQAAALREAAADVFDTALPAECARYLEERAAALTAALAEMGKR